MRDRDPARMMRDVLTGRFRNANDRKKRLVLRLQKAGHPYSVIRGGCSVPYGTLITALGQKTLRNKKKKKKKKKKGQKKKKTHSTGKNGKHKTAHRQEKTRLIEGRSYRTDIIGSTVLF